MKPHRFDPISLVFGVVFLLAAGSAVWYREVDWDLGLWVVPVAVLVLGVGLLTSAVRSVTDRSNPPDESA